MPKSSIADMYQGPNISGGTIYRTTRDFEGGIPCLNSRKSRRPEILTEI